MASCMEEGMIEECSLLGKRCEMHPSMFGMNNVDHLFSNTSRQCTCSGIYILPELINCLCTLEQGMP